MTCIVICGICRIVVFGVCSHPNKQVLDYANRTRRKRDPHTVAAAGLSKATERYEPNMVGDKDHVKVETCNRQNIYN